MASTIKIRKSKHLAYQKQGFLYLVFILFLFFTQAGEYVIHYMPLAKTQKELNTYLEGRLAALNLSDPDADAYRDDVLERVHALGTIEDEFKTYGEQNIAGLDQFRESRFAELRVRRGRLGDLYSELWSAQQAQSQGAWTPERVEDYEGRSYLPTQFFFRETPNAVLPSLVEHTKTAFLVEALTDLNEEALVFQKYNVERLEKAGFTSVFKKQLFLGENFELELHAVAPEDSIVSVRINERPQRFLTKEDGIALAYRPGAWGEYFVEINTVNGRFYTSFEVVRPRVQFTPQKNTVSLTQGVTSEISIDESALPPGVVFESDFAQTSYENGLLSITPLAAGSFVLKVMVDGVQTDELSLNAQPPATLKVALTNALGAPSDLNTAHRLQSVNPNFQVLNYEATFYPKDGSAPRSVTSNSRLIRPELQEWVSTAGTMHFKNIVLLAKDGLTRVDGAPLILQSNE